jgi:type IV secretion system protein TrbC
MPLQSFRPRLAGAYTFLVLSLATAQAFAAGSNMPWEQPLNQILQSVQGPVAKVISVIIIVITGLILAFGETCGREDVIAGWAQVFDDGELGEPAG